VYERFKTVLLEHFQESSNKNEDAAIAIDQVMRRTLDRLSKKEMKKLDSSYDCEDYQLPPWSKVPAQIQHDILCVIASAKMINESKTFEDCGIVRLIRQLTSTDSDKVDSKSVSCKI